MTRRRARVLVAGRVQGVGFRWATQRRAEQLGVDGWVRNLFDGRVEVWAEGDAADVERLVDWLREGPSHAGVERIEVADGEPAGHRGFDVRPTHAG